MRRKFLLTLLATVPISNIWAQPEEPVLTRANVRSIAEKNGKTYVYLKIMPRSKTPFTTQTILVRDKNLIANMPQGQEVGFAAEHIAGENTLTAIRKIAPCVRFRACPAP